MGASLAQRIDARLVGRLVAAQFPQWSRLPVAPVLPGGWDHASFRLGEDLVARLPRAVEYAAQVEKEHAWLPRLAPLLPVAIPEPLAIGEPGEGYPWKWSVYGWIDGEPASTHRPRDAAKFAGALACFLVSLQGADAREGPPPGAHNFHRGGSLSTYDAQLRKAVAMLDDEIDTTALRRIWQAALGSSWMTRPVWVHGDIAPGNLLLRDGELAAVIDFGLLAAGDPACDLAIAWSFFERGEREVFRARLAPDLHTWARAKGWALWKASIVAAGLVETNAPEWNRPLAVIERILEDMP